MGFLDDLKKATGVGLTHVEHYLRAFEKGVLLGPAHYGEAASLFETAATKAAEAQDHGLVARARANCQLYAFLARGEPRVLYALVQALANVPEIEVVGSQSEVTPAGPLQAEIAARIIEVEVAQVSITDHSRLHAMHEHAAGAFKSLFSTPLVTYRFHSSDPHVDSGQSRFFFHSGLAAWHEAQGRVAVDPDGAADGAAKALAAFRQCNDARWVDEAQRWLTNCRTKRTCWMCNREMQGAGIHFRTYSAELAPYAVERARALGQDTSGLDAPTGILVLCTPCGSAVERQADAIAARRTEAVRQELSARLAALDAAVAVLNARVAALSFGR